MDFISDLVSLIVGAAIAIAAPETVPLERQLAHTYQVGPGATVLVDISGGRISVVPSSGRDATVRLIQRVHTTSEREAENALRDYTVVMTQDNGGVRLTTRRSSGASVGLWRRPRVQMDAELTVPPDVVLDVKTSGGSIEIRGERTARIDAHTSGGSIKVEGGSGPIAVNTSGGSIRIGRTTSTLRARTSGGSVHVDHVAASASDVDVSTSGGSVHVGVSPEARLAVDASTSGGRVSVSVSDLRFTTSRRSNSHVTGALNGGGGRLRAHTSGGSVRIEGR